MDLILLNITRHYKSNDRVDMSENHAIGVLKPEEM